MNFILTTPFNSSQNKFDLFEWFNVPNHRFPASSFVRCTEVQLTQDAWNNNDFDQFPEHKDALVPVKSLREREMI